MYDHATMINDYLRPSTTLVKSAEQKNNFLISQSKQMLWVLKRTVAMSPFEHIC